MHKKKDMLLQQRDPYRCVPVYKVTKQDNIGKSGGEWYYVEPVYDGHGDAEWQTRHELDAIPTPQCMAKTHTHCGETAQKTGQQAQKVSSSSEGSGFKGLEGKTGAATSRKNQKAPRAPQDNNYRSRYSSHDHPPPYDAVMMEQSLRIPLDNSVGADDNLLDVGIDNTNENVPEKNL